MHKDKNISVFWRQEAPQYAIVLGLHDEELR